MVPASTESGPFRLGPVLRSAVQDLHRASGADLTSLFLYDAEARRYYAPFAVGLPEDGLLASLTDMGEQLAAYQEDLAAGKVPGELRDDAQRMVDLALSEIRILEELDFTDIIVSVKAFEVPKMIAAYRRLAKAVPYPLHLGVTESGTLLSGSVRSTAGMSVLLYEGIGDTIRVSLSEDPVTEVRAAFDILKSLELRDQGLTLVACPSCGRADIDLIPLAKVAEERLRALPVPMKIAVMGCEVNGPGEAKDADVGIAGGQGKGAIFRKGKVVGVFPEADLMDALLAEIDKILIENGKEPYSQKAPKLSHEGQLTPGRSVPAGTRT
jgi:(E)-4-hydroxy-3-methylbut-2-enyl-diphosphate synthase